MSEREELPLMSKREELLFAESDDFSCGFCTGVDDLYKGCDKCLLPVIAKSLAELSEYTRAL